MNKTVILLLFPLFFACTDVEQPALRPSGADLFRKHCVLCHGAAGNLGLNGARDLTQSKLNREQRIQIVSNGKAAMPVFRQLLTTEEIEAVAEYTLTLSNPIK